MTAPPLRSLVRRLADFVLWLALAWLDLLELVGYWRRVVCALPAALWRLAPVVWGVAHDLQEPRDALVEQVALLRYQVATCNRVLRPDPVDRFNLGLLAGWSRTWRKAHALAWTPQTILRWRREGLRLLARHGVQPRRRPARIGQLTRDLLRDMARKNRLWGAERLRGELVKLGLGVAKRTVQRHLRRDRPDGRPGGQGWRTFLANHAPSHWRWPGRLARLGEEVPARLRAAVVDSGEAEDAADGGEDAPDAGAARERGPARHRRRGWRSRRRRGEWARFVRAHGHEIWACDYFTVTTALFRRVTVFFLIHVGSRRVVHCAATYSPSATWTARQLRAALGKEAPPRFLIRDRDGKYGKRLFDRTARAGGVERVIRTPPRCPRANAFAERWVQSARREALDHFLFLDVAHVERVLREYVSSYYNRGRPHQGLGQRVPGQGSASSTRSRRPGSSPDPSSAGSTASTRARRSRADPSATPEPSRSSAPGVRDEVVARRYHGRTGAEHVSPVTSRTQASDAAVRSSRSLHRRSTRWRLCSPPTPRTLESSHDSGPCRPLGVGGSGPSPASPRTAAASSDDGGPLGVVGVCSEVAS